VELSSQVGSEALRSTNVVGSCTSMCVPRLVVDQKDWEHMESWQHAHGQLDSVMFKQGRTQPCAACTAFATHRTPTQEATCVPNRIPCTPHTSHRASTPQSCAVPGFGGRASRGCSTGRRASASERCAGRCAYVRTHSSGLLVLLPMDTRPVGSKPCCHAESSGADVLQPFQDVETSKR
jgi:hypothetical protein